MTDLIDVEDLVMIWAKEMFDSTFRKNNPKANIPPKSEDLLFEIDWRRVKFEHKVQELPPVQALQNQKKCESKVAFRSRFKNVTSAEQKHAFKAERSTTSTCEVRLEKAVCTGVGVNLALKVPLYDVCEANIGFGREVTVNNSQGETVETVLRWEVNSEITVPQQTETTAELVISEESFEMNFSADSRLWGRVRAVVRNPLNNNCFLATINGDIANIIDKYAKEKHRKLFRFENGVAHYVTTGSCRLNYGIEQHVTLRQEACVA